MAINFVIGPPCSGKSYFIKQTFPDAIVINLWDYQKDLKYINIENVIESYELAKKDLIKAIKNNPEKQIVFEHTLLKAIRRKDYIDSIKDVSNDKINCYVLKPNVKDIKKYCKLRNLDFYEVKEAYNILEIPTKNEGFDNIFIVKSL